MRYARTKLIVALLVTGLAACGYEAEPEVAQNKAELTDGWETIDAQEVVLLSTHSPYVMHCVGTTLSTHWILTSAYCLPSNTDQITVRVTYRDPGHGAFIQTYPAGTGFGAATVYRDANWQQLETNFALVYLHDGGMGANWYPGGFFSGGDRPPEGFNYLVAGYGETAVPLTKAMGTLYAHNYFGIYPFMFANGWADTGVFDRGAPWFAYDWNGRRIIAAMTSHTLWDSKDTYASPINGWLKLFLIFSSAQTPHPLACFDYGPAPWHYFVCYE